MQSPAHGETVLVSLSGQFAPPSAGAGLVQVLVSVLVPPPQVEEQVPSVQALQPPSTGVKVTGEKKQVLKMNLIAKFRAT